MIHHILNEINERVAKSFSVDCSPQKAANIISEETNSGFFVDGVVGGVKDTHVHLRYKMKLDRNSFSPHFVGQLKDEFGKTKLVGSFSLNPIIKVFLYLWFSGIILGSLIFLGIGFCEGGIAGIVVGFLFFLFCIFFGAIGLYFLQWGKRRNFYTGIEEITTHIQNCFNKVEV